jgi:hypothetical protein
MEIEEADRTHYENVPREIRARTDLVNALLAQANNSRIIGASLQLLGFLQIESAALHLRKVLELIVLGP